MSKRIAEHLRSNVWGLVAVFIALSGTAVAAGIAPKNSVRSKSIKNGQVKTVDVARGAIAADKVAPNSLTGAQIEESSFDPSVLQHRVTGSCPGGQAVESIGADGNVGCAGTGGPPSGPAGGGLSGSYPDPAIAPDSVDSDTVRDNSLTGADVDESRLFARTRVVSPVGTSLENGQALRDALASLDTSGGKEYVLKLEPGSYDVGASPLQLRDHVDLFGSGSGNTGIVRNGGGVTMVAPSTAQAEVHDVLVRSFGSTAVQVQGILRLEDDAITATGSGAGIVGVQATGAGVTTVVDSLVFAQSSGTNNFGAAVASDGGTSVDVIDSRLSALATGTGGFGTALSINGDGKVIGSRLIGDGGGGSGAFGAIDNGSNSTLTIDSSIVQGATRAIGAAATDKILIGASKVIGGHDAVAAGTVTCIFSYKADYTATNATCD